MDISKFTSSGQLPPEELARQRAYFQDNPPSFLGERYVTKPLDPGGLAFDGHGEVINPCFAIVCKACGGHDHTVRLGRQGLATTCLGCGEDAVILGQSGPGDTQSCGCGASVCQPGIRFEYPGDLFSVDWYKGCESEQFSWVSVIGTCADCGTARIIADMETS